MHDLALEMITRAVDDKVPGDILLADSGYGDSHEFREAVRILGFDYALGIHATTTMWRLDHFEGRSFPGWNHHVSVALCCYAFVLGERLRHFPPTTGRQSAARVG